MKTTLNDLIVFVDKNKIDYSTDIKDILNAYEAVNKIKGKTPLDIVLEKNEKLDAKAEKFQFEIEKEKMLRDYNFHFTPKVVIGKKVAEAIQDADYFHPDNVMLLTDNITYIGYFDHNDDLINPEKIEQHHIRVFVDSSPEKDPIEAEFNCYESYASKALSDVFRDVYIKTYVCR